MTPQTLLKPEACRACPGFDSSISTGFAGPDSPDKNYLRLGIFAEASGESEATLGIPLIGTTGKEVRKLLYQYGFDEDTTIFDNTLRCRPTNNIYPSGQLAVDMLIHCRQWDGPLDRYNPDVLIFCYHFTYSMIRPGGPRYSAPNAFRKARLLSNRGHRPLIVTGDKAKSLLLPRLDGPISKWDGKHFFVNWQKTKYESIVKLKDFKEEMDRKAKPSGRSWRDLLKERKGR